MHYIFQQDMHFVPKGWGWEKWIWNDSRYCGKILHFEVGKKCSWHYHKVKDEVLYLESGRMLVTFSEEDDISQAKTVVLETGDAFHVPTGLRHQMMCIDGPAEIIEFSTHHDDADSIRVTKGD